MSARSEVAQLANGNRKASRIFRFDVLANRRDGEPIYIMPSRQEALSLIQQGHAATDYLMAKPNADEAEVFNDAPIAILAGHDGLDSEYAYDQFKMLNKYGKAHIVRTPDHKISVAQWVARSGGILELRKAAHAALKLPAPVTKNTPAAPERDPRQHWQDFAMSELADIDPKVNWLAEGIWAPGHGTLFNSLYKAGKTTFGSLLYFSLQTGRPFLGRKTNVSNTIIVSEESKQLWRIRRDKVGLNDNHRVISKPFMAKPTLREWIEFNEYLHDLAIKRNAQGIVFDTIGNMAPWRDENDAAAVGEALLPLNRLTSAGIGVMLVHHMGKGDGSEGRASRGSTAIPAFADIIIELRRHNPSDNTDRRRVLTGYGRFDEIPSELVIELNEAGTEYIAQGDRHAVKATELHTAIMEALKDELPGQTAGEIHERMEKDVRPRESKLRQMLRDGAKKDHWVESGSGSPNSPYRFRLRVVPMLL